MKRSIRPALGVAILALALPSAALATHDRASTAAGQARHAFPVTPAPPPPAATVTSYTGGVLTLAPTGGGPSIAGVVTGQTRFLCVRTGRGRGFAPATPCDGSQLVSGAGVLSAGVRITQAGVQFSDIVLLPAVQGPVTS